MSYKGDIKSVRVTATGAVFAGRTRLRGIILASDGGGAERLYFKTIQIAQLCFKLTFLQEMFFQ